MKKISILGSGWLGLPLVQCFTRQGYKVKASTTSKHRFSEIEAKGAEAYIVNTEYLDKGVQEFLDADILVINIPSKSIENYISLVDEINLSEVKCVLFISSTSVYRNVDSTISESNHEYYSDSPLLEIENMMTALVGKVTTIVRFGGLIGYDRHPGKFFSEGRVIRQPNSAVNLIHLDDCIAIIERIINMDAWGEVFNCCADTHPSKCEFYTHAANSSKLQQLKFDNTDCSKGKVISNEKVKRRLNYDFIRSDLMAIEF